MDKLFFPVGIGGMRGHWMRTRSCGSMTTMTTTTERRWRRVGWRMTSLTPTASTWRPKKVRRSAITVGTSERPPNSVTAFQEAMIFTFCDCRSCQCSKRCQQQWENSCNPTCLTSCHSKQQQFNLCSQDSSSSCNTSSKGKVSG